jgi:hypothetical protein
MVSERDARSRAHRERGAPLTMLKIAEVRAAVAARSRVTQTEASSGGAAGLPLVRPP